MGRPYTIPWPASSKDRNSPPNFGGVFIFAAGGPRSEWGLPMAVIKKCWRRYSIYMVVEYTDIYENIAIVPML